MMATEEELDAATEGLQFMLDQYRDKQSWEGYPRKLRDGIAAITNLRAQIAGARANEAALAEIRKTLAAPDDWHPVDAVKALKRSHDWAEAALATVFGDGLRTAISVIASIGYGKNEDVDAGHEEAFRAVEKYLTDWTIGSQPRAGAAEHGSYDRTTLDRMLAEAREKALREAAAICKADFDCKKSLGVGVEPQHEAILAPIEAPAAKTAV